MVGATLAWAASLDGVLRRLVGLPRSPLRSALALACWPGSFALVLVYPDALALAAAAWAAAFALRGKPLAAGALGVVAALARPNGVLIALRSPGSPAGRASAAGSGRCCRWWRPRVSRRTSGLAATARPCSSTRSGSGAAAGPQSSHWADQLAAALQRHGLLIGPLAAAAVVGLALAWRRFGAWPTAVAAYVCAVPLLLAATRSLEGFVDSARAALVLPLLVLLWKLGPRYRPWAAFSTVVVGLLLLSGTMQSFGRQSLFAFPIFWAVADGPRWLRSLPLAVLGFAGNIVLALLLTHFAP